MDSSSQSSYEPIAIIGMGCRFAGGIDSPEAFWDFLSSENEATRDLPGAVGRVRTARPRGGLRAQGDSHPWLVHG